MDLLDLELARKDELPQDLTPSQMENIKSQFHPSSTANVKIIPYHIYDEDEHIVGEWRQMVDGIKKKKPVYERTMTYDVSSTHSDNYTINYDTPISGFEKLVAVNGIVYRGSENGYIEINSYESSGYYFLVKGISGSSFTIKNQGYSGVLDITIRYTKTSDTWEEV